MMSNNLIHKKVPLTISATANGKLQEVCHDKIGVFEKGFNFEKSEGKGHRLKMWVQKDYVNQGGKKVLEGILEDFQDGDINLSINKRGKEKVSFGYNKNGDLCFIEFITPKTAYVGCYYLDQEKNMNLCYYFGIEGDNLRGFFDRSKAAVFNVDIGTPQ